MRNIQKLGNNSFLNPRLQLQGVNNASFTRDAQWRVEAGTNIRGYKVLSKLGEEAYGMVYRVIDVLHNSYAMKIVLQRSNQPVLREYELLQQLGPDRVAPTPVDLLQNENGCTCMVMEYLPQKFSEFITRDALSKQELQATLRRVTMAIRTLHRRRIIFADLTADNLLLREPGNLDSIMLVGFSKAMREPLLRYRQDVQRLRCMAPEVLQGQPYNQKIDMWALGCLLFEAAVGRQLFPASSANELMLQLLWHFGADGVTVYDERFFRPFSSAYYISNQTVLAGLGYSEESLYLPSYSVLRAASGALQRPAKIEEALAEAFGNHNACAEQLSELLRGLLAYDMDDRWDCDMVLNSRFLCQ